MDGQPGISLRTGRTDARQLGNQNILPVPTVYGVSCSCFNATCLIQHRNERSEFVDSQFWHFSIGICTFSHTCTRMNSFRVILIAHVRKTIICSRHQNGSKNHSPPPPSRFLLVWLRLAPFCRGSVLPRVNQVASCVCLLLDNPVHQNH